jgi:hypothetical protein
LKVDEEWRDILREARFYPDELHQQIFEPNQPWNKWQVTDAYSIHTRLSDRGLLCTYSKAVVDAPIEKVIALLENVEIRTAWDPNV